MNAPWEWPLAGKAILVVIVYAASDEIHQLFVPSREGTLRDVIIDTIGGTCGLVALWALGRCLGWWNRGEKANAQNAVKRAVDKA